MEEKKKMPQRVPRIFIDGKEYKTCPVCNGPLTINCYNRYRKCMECNKLEKTGLQIDEIKAIRKTQMMNSLKDKEVFIELNGEKKPFNVNSDPKVSFDKFKDKTEIYGAKYDFINSYPPGVTIICNTKEESRVVKDAYEQYGSGIENISQFNSLVNAILFNTLEGYRISLKISQGNIVLDKTTGEPTFDVNGNKKYTEISSSDKKDLIDLQMKLSKNTTDTSRFIEDLKQTALADSGNVLMKEFSNMLKYHFDNDQMYTGVGECDTCNKRVIFKTNFITFRNHYEKQFIELVERLKKLNNVDVKTIEIVKDAFMAEINDDSIKETYLIKHTRALEKALM